MPELPVGRSAHVDTFARDHLPPKDQWPEMDFSALPVRYGPQINCAEELLDKRLSEFGARPAIIHGDVVWSYAELAENTNRIAHVLTRDLGIVPGNRVLLRAPNTRMMAACWLAVMKVGAIAVPTMPLLRARELTYIADKAEVGLALCDARLADELERARENSAHLRDIVYFGTDASDGLEARMARASADFKAVDTAADDVCLIAFTSGTTGNPKGTMHFHRDIIAVTDCFPRSTLKPTQDDIFTGSPPLAFTFGLGGLLLFPMRFGAATALIEQPTPENLLAAIARHRVSVLFTAPVAFRAMLDLLKDFDISSLAKCVSAGETLPLPTFTAWHEATGIKIIDGLGSTEMLHIFIAAAGDDIRPGATGKPIPGYQARIVGEDGVPLPPGEVGRLAVRGPTGCRYLSDERQTSYVVDGWNLTGDAYLMDEDGYFWFQARADDMIISAGYNISGPEVEEALLAHPAVAECAVIGAPDERRGTIVKAIVVPASGVTPDEALIKELQDFVKSQIAPYKYPRAIAFADSLPRTETGKIQRFKLRQREQAGK